MGWDKSSRAGHEAFRGGGYEKAEQHLKAAVSAAKKFGATDRRLALSLGDLGMLYHSLGRLSEAEPLYRRAIAIDEKNGDTDDQNSAVTLENLAELYKTQQRAGESAAMYRRAMAIMENIFKTVKK